jgi:hypothetical protein
MTGVPPDAGRHATVVAYSALEADPLPPRSHERSLAKVRWLARRVLSPDVAALARTVPTPCLVSAHPRRVAQRVRKYVVWWVKHAVGGSAFEAKTRWLRWLPERLLVRVLLARGYDGLLYVQGESIAGHVFFQRHGDALHAFSTAVSKELEGDGYSVVMMLDFVAYGAQLAGIRQVRIGRARNNATRRLLARIARHDAALGCQVLADGWVSLAPSVPATEREWSR